MFLHRTVLSLIERLNILQYLSLLILKGPFEIPVLHSPAHITFYKIRINNVV